MKQINLFDSFNWLNTIKKNLNINAAASFFLQKVVFEDSTVCVPSKTPNYIIITLSGLIENSGTKNLCLEKKKLIQFYEK